MGFRSGYYVSDEHELVVFKAAHLGFQEKAGFHDSVQHRPQLLKVFLEGAAEHNNVVQVHDAGLPPDSGKYSACHPLKRFRCPTKSDRRHVKLVEAIWCDEGLLL